MSVLSPPHPMLPGRWAWAELAAILVVGAATAVVAVEFGEGLVGVPLAIFWFILVKRAFVRRWRRAISDPWLRRVLLAGLLMRAPIVAAHLMVGVVILKWAVDFFGYFQQGVRYSGMLLSGDLDQFLDVSFGLTGGYAIIGRMQALAVFLIGPSLPGMFMLSGILGFVGAYLFVRAFQVEYPAPRQIRFFALAMLFFPSLAFWSSLLGKESWMFFFLGLTTYCVAHMLRHPWPRYVVGTAAGLLGTLVVRAPIGLAAAGAVGIVSLLAVNKELWARGPARVLRPVRYVVLAALIGAGISVGATVLRGSTAETAWASPAVYYKLLQTMAIKNEDLARESARKGVVVRVHFTDATIGGFLRFLPQGMFGFLFRPFLFEAHNALALIAALDSTLLMLLVFLRLRHLLVSIVAAVRRPFLVYCWLCSLLFSATLAFEVNFGVLVRHRSMVLPFLLVLLAVPVRRDAASDDPAVVPAGDAAAVSSRQGDGGR